MHLKRRDTPWTAASYSHVNCSITTRLCVTADTFLNRLCPSLTQPRVTERVLPNATGDYQNDTNDHKRKRDDEDVGISLSILAHVGLEYLMSVAIEPFHCKPRGVCGEITTENQLTLSFRLCEQDRKVSGSFGYSTRALGVCSSQSSAEMVCCVHLDFECSLILPPGFKSIQIWPGVHQ